MDKIRQLIVCILGHRIVPNIQFFKEKRTVDTDFLFISDPDLEEDGVRLCIKRTFGINGNELDPIIVDEYDDAAVLEEELKRRHFEGYEHIFVNVSEGSIVSANVTVEFFKDYIAEIFYLPDTIHYMVQIFPKRKRGKIEIRNKIGLEEYLACHGLEMRGGQLSGISIDYMQKFLIIYLNSNTSDREVISEIRKYRGKKERYPISNIPKLAPFLLKIDFPLSDPTRTYISRNEIGFLTGDWFEEFVYYRIKDEFNLPEDNIKTGVVLIKDGVRNEFDVMFFYDGMLYTIECKTSIGSKGNNIMTDTIYKVKALQNNLGYYSDSNIFTLSERNSDEVRREHLERGEVFGIDVYCREDLLNCRDIPNMLKIKNFISF